MTTKKLINSVDGCVDDALRGLVSVHSSLRILQGHKIVVREDVEEVIKAGKVTLLCGGGSGHEPAQAGYVGRGMLTVAVAGAVFASPPPSSILTALRYVTKLDSAGCVVVITNYTGDRLNFGLAIERAKREGLKVDSITIGEDCALTSSDRSAGRRGLAGTVLLNKICGALAEEGKSLEEIVKIGKHVTENMGTMGVSLTPCSVPGSGPTFSLGEDEMELGLETADMLYDMIKLSMERLISSEEDLNNLDKESGDGDCGSTLARGAKAILKELGQKEKPNLPVDTPAALALSLARIVENSMGGSSGALYSLFFTSASHSLQNDITMTGWKEALSNGTSTIMRYGGAQPGDRTMVDALFAANSALKTSESLSSPVRIMENVVQATESAAQATASMKAQAGRASYVSADRLKNPDPGAVAVTVWFKAVLDILKKT